jgi:hypothetical protein
MQFRETWQRLLKSVDALPSDATLVTPVSSRSFRVVDIQDRQLLIAYQDDSGETGSPRRSHLKLPAKASPMLPTDSTSTGYRQMARRMLLFSVYILTSSTIRVKAI